MVTSCQCVTNHPCANDAVLCSIQDLTLVELISQGTTWMVEHLISDIEVQSELLSHVLV